MGAGIWWVGMCSGGRVSGKDGQFGEWCDEAGKEGSEA